MFYAVVRQISMLFIDNKDSVFYGLVTEIQIIEGHIYTVSGS